MRTAAGITTAVTLLVLAGCGGQPSSAEEFEGEQRQVADVIEELQSAGQRREPEKICTSILSGALRERIEAAGSDCVAEMRKAIEDADAFELTVEEVTITGTSATAVVKGDAGGDGDATRTFRFAKEDGAWRATSFGAS